MQYIVIHHINLNDFVELVNQSLEEGWQLYGDTFKDGVSYYQPMTRELFPTEKSRLIGQQEYNFSSDYLPSGNPA